MLVLLKETNILIQIIRDKRKLKGAKSSKVIIIAAKHCKRVALKMSLLNKNTLIESATVIP